MARPRKKGLDYFSFDVDFFSDKKIKRLRAKFGSSGVIVYIYLLCEIYRKGYYIDYDEDLILDISDEMNISENATKQIMNYLLSRSLFDDKLAKSVKVLTAASIQQRYLKAKSASSNSNVEIEDRYCLLKNDDIDTSLEVHPKKGFSENNAGFSEKNLSKSENNNIKESKVKERYLLTSGNQSKNLSTVSTIPTFEEVESYIQEIGGGVDAQKFFNTYSARDWKTKKGNPLDWKCAAIYWQNTEGKFKDKPKSKSESIPESPMAEAYKKLIYNIDE